MAYSGTATAGTDYIGNITTHTISPTKTSVSWKLTGKTDNTTEGDETIVINVTSVTNATEKGTQRETLTLTDNVTTEPTVTMSCDQHDRVVINEIGYSQIFCIFSLSHIIAEQANITLAFSGTAIAGTDYEFIGSGWENHPCEVGHSSCYVLAGQASNNGTNLILYDHDAVWDGSQTVIIDIDSVTNATEDGTQQAEMTLNNDGQL